MAWEDIMTEYVLSGSIWLFGIAAVAAFVFGPVMSIISNPRGVVRSIIAIVALGIVFAIGYSMANPEMKPFYQEFGVADEGASQLVGGGLLTFYILMGIAVVGIVITEIHNVIK